MNKILLIQIFLVFISINLNVSGQQKAFTDTGDEVVLYKDKTWKYKSEVDKKEVLKTISKAFEKDTNSTFLLKSKINEYGVYIDIKNIDFSKEKFLEEAEFNLINKKRSIWIMMTNEDIDLPLVSVRDEKIRQLTKSDSKYEVLEEDYRFVNGNKVVHMRFRFKDKGITTIMCIYLTSSSVGTAQLITGTTEGKFNDYKDEMYKILNGLVKYQK